MSLTVIYIESESYILRQKYILESILYCKICFT
jgi:hypothetical protein